MKQRMINNVITTIYAAIIYVVLSNSHFLPIFPCNITTEDGYTDSSMCELIDVTRHAEYSGARLTSTGQIVAMVVIVGVAYLLTFLTRKFIFKKKQ